MKKLYLYLTYAGALPFIICAVCLAFDITLIPLLGTTKQVLSVYALTIATFIAGNHWGQHLYMNNKWQYHLPILSNIIVITLWFGFLILPFRPLLAILIVAFLVLLIIDQRLFRHNLITRRYFQMRCFATAIVVSTLVISGIVVWWVLFLKSLRISYSL